MSSFRGLAREGTLLIRRTPNGGIRHVAWEVAGKFYHAYPNAERTVLTVQEMSIISARQWFNPRLMQNGTVDMIRIDFANFERAIPALGEQSSSCVMAAFTAYMNGNYWMPAWAAGATLLRAIGIGNEIGEELAGGE